MVLRENPNPTEMKEVTIYTDGGARGNPGPGGYGVVMIFGAHRKELSGGYEHTTNNRMELLAAIKSLEVLTEPCHIHFHSDSKYLIDAMTKHWLSAWKKRGWLKSDRKPVLNKDLWQRLDEVATHHRIDWTWVKGHAGNEFNERCDALVHEAIDSGELQIDRGYAQGGISEEMDLF